MKTYTFVNEEAKKMVISLGYTLTDAALSFKAEYGKLPIQLGFKWRKDHE
jgi:hypothetical protein